MIELYEPDMAYSLQEKPVAWVDGVRFPIANKWSNNAARKQDQSGEKKLTIRKMILIFDPFGKCVCAVINANGKWPDSRPCAAFGLYEEVDQLPPGYCILSDTAFRGAVANAKIIKTLKVGEFLPAGMSQDELEERETIIVRARQPSEWANNQLVQAMKRLRATLGIDDTFNTTLMELSLLLYNYRVHFSPRNELKRVFMNLEAFHDDPELREQLGLPLNPGEI